MVIWSWAWISGKLVANAAPPTVTLFWRYILSSLALAPLLPVLGESFRISWRQAGWILLGSAIITLYSWLFFYGLKTGYAGAAGVLVTSMNPIFTYFLTRMLFRQTLTRRDTIGLIMGLVGGAILLEVWNLSQDKVLLSGNLLFFICALIYAFVTLATNAATKRVSIIVYSFYVNFGGALLLLPFVGGDLTQTPVFSGIGFSDYWSNVFFLGAISNGFATTVYFFAVKNLGSARASSYVFLVPATALFMAAWYLNEPVKPATIAGGLIALVAVTLLRRSRAA